MPIDPVRPLLLLVCALATAVEAAALPKPADVLRLREALGGAVGVFGTSDGVLEERLAEHGRWLVHGIALSAEACATARRHLGRRGLTGLATIELAVQKDRLPYAENLLNLLIVDLDAADFRQDEVLRCVAPGGIAHVHRAGRWQSITKPMPAEMGEWTHSQGSAGHNAVSSDRLIQPITTVRWIDGYATTGYHMTGSSPPLAHGGYLVHDVIWSLRDQHGARVTENRLVARDAFNGIMHWQSAIRSTDSSMAMSNGRLLAAQDRPGADKGITVYDLRTGAVQALIGTPVRERGVPATRQMICARGDHAWFNVEGVVVCHDLARNREVWRYAVPEGIAFTPSLSDDGDLVMVCESTVPFGPRARWPASPLRAVTGLDAATGKVRWRNTELAGLWVSYTPLSGDTAMLFTTWGILASLTESVKKEDRDQTQREVVALDVKTGTIRWRRQWNDPQGYGPRSLQVGFIRGDRVWAGEPSHMVSWDLRSGARRDMLRTPVANQRCTRNRATVDWILMGFGTFLGADGRMVDQNISRSGCTTGPTPAYGMLFNTSNACGCFAQVRGFAGFAHEAPVPPLTTGRLQAGPGPDEAGQWPAEPAAITITEQSKGDKPGRQVRKPQASDQPVRDSWVSHEDFPVPETEPVSLPDGRSLVAVVNQHRLECRQQGRVVWTMTADARITCPPVVVGEQAFVGASDGWVYAVDLATGARRWRAHVAPGWRRIVAYGQMESAWPVRQLAVHQGLICAAAGRHPELDGGIRVVGLDPQSGKERWRDQVAHDSATQWFAADERRPQVHQQWHTNGGVRVDDGKLVLFSHDAVHGGGGKRPPLPVLGPTGSATRRP